MRTVAVGGLRRVQGGAGAEPETAKDAQAKAQPEREPPPPPSEPKDMSLPPVHVASLDNGLQLNTVVTDQLPVVYATLVVRSGGESDPAKLPGLAGLVAQMLKEGTTKRSSAEIAEQIEFLGADLWASSDEENTYVGVRALAEQFDVVMAILAEVAGTPAFNNKELEKLKRRELDRLALSEREPRYIARRTFYRQLYGQHPYGTVDTTPQAVKRVRRQDMVRWHREHFVGKNAFLVVAGDVDPDHVAEAAQKTFSAWKAGKRSVPTYREPPQPDQPQHPGRRSPRVGAIGHLHRQPGDRASQSRVDPPHGLESGARGFCGIPALHGPPREEEPDVRRVQLHQ